MGRKKKNIIIIICVLSIVIVYFSINFLIWGIVPPKKKIYFLNNEVSLKYERKKRNNGIISVVYKDSAGNDYIFDRNGKLSGYYDVGGGADFPGYDAAEINPSDDSDEALIYSLGQKAKTVFEELIIDKSRISQYELVTSETFTSYGVCQFSFVKSINGFNTNDTLSIAIDRDGKIKSYTGSRQGIFDNLTVNADRSDIEKFIDEKVNSRYKNQTVKYNVNSMTIDKKKNKFYIRCFVGVETEEYITGDEYEYRLK